MYGKTITKLTSTARNILKRKHFQYLAIAATCLVAVQVQASIDPERSLLITDKTVLSEFDLTAPSGVLATMIANSTNPTQTPQQFMQDWPLPFGTCRGSTFNGFERRCIRTDMAANTFKPIALINRFDLAPTDGQNCGEYRIAFASTRDSFDLARHNAVTFLILEATLQNPNSALGLEACRPVVDFWASLSLESDVNVRAQKLKAFYFNGLTGFDPIFTAKNYSGSENGRGQIRINQRADQKLFWEFFEFVTEEDNNVLSLAQSTTNENPFWDLSSDSSLFPIQAQQFQNAVISGLSTNGTGLLADTVQKMSLALPVMTELGFAIEFDGSELARHGDSIVRFFEPNSNFASAIQAQLNTIASSLTPAQIIARTDVMSCGGCHNNSLDLGGGLSFDSSNISVEMLSIEGALVGSAEHVEAESFTQSFDVRTQSTSDEGGGQNVGWINNGSSMTYQVNVPPSPTGIYRVSYRVASRSANGSISLRNSITDEVYDSNLTFESTLGWQKWKTVFHNVRLTEGPQSLKIVASEGGWNLNWVEIQAVGDESYGVKAPLRNIFLPERKAHMESYLSACSNCSGPNLLNNGDFSAGHNSWQQYVHGWSDAMIELGGTHSDARISMHNGGNQTWHVQLRQGGLNIEQGHTYKLSFDANTTGSVVNGEIVAVVEEDGGDYTHYMPEAKLSASPGVHTFTYVFTMSEPTDGAARVTFNLGDFYDLPYYPGKSIVLDNVQLVELN